MTVRLIVCLICGLHYAANMNSLHPRLCPSCRRKKKDAWK